MVLVEGRSDRAAVETLARRQGRDLDAEGITVVAMGGATNIGRFLLQLGPAGADLRLAGLYDVAEEGYFRRGAERAGLGSVRHRADLETLGFFVCTADLEDELIRTLGWRAVESVLEREGDLRSFRLLQQQPAQQDRSVDQQLRRFFGSGSGSKIRYGALLVEALDPARVPAPLERLLDHV